MPGLLITCTVIVCWSAIAAFAVACLHHSSQQQGSDRQACRNCPYGGVRRPSWGRPNTRQDRQ